MSELIVTCAGCGKKYKGAIPGKKFKCAECLNLFKFPTEVRIPAAGNTFCTFCWTELPMTEVLSACANCEQKVAPRVVGRATTPAHVSQPQPAVRSSGASPAVKSNAASAAVVGDPLQLLTKERDELLEKQKQMDRTMGSLMEQLAIAKSQANAAAIGGGDDALRRELQLQMRDLKSRVSQLEDDVGKVSAERDMANTASQAWEEKYSEMQARAAEFAAKAAELETRLATTATVAVRPEHKATAGNSALAAQLADLQKANEALKHERDEALANLDQLRATAVQALTPLGVDCSDAMKRLITETEATIDRLREQFDQQLKQSGEKLKDQMKQCRRELVDRFSEVLGTSGEMGNLQSPASDESAESNSHAEHAA